MEEKDERRKAEKGRSRDHARIKEKRRKERNLDNQVNRQKEKHDNWRREAQSSEGK